MSYVRQKAIQTLLDGFFFISKTSQCVWSTDMSINLLVIDNYDSFTYNLVQLFLNIGVTLTVHRNDRITLSDIHQLQPEAILISPGPKDPSQSGISPDVIRQFFATIPILGVCLGMQCLNEFFGGSTLKAPIPVHGKTSLIWHKRRGILRNLSNPLRVARYHSLQVRPDQNNQLQVDAVSTDGVIMAMSHPKLPLYGVQFHPESFLTDEGWRIGKAFVEITALSQMPTEAIHA
jgi:anthranilate synthase component 2